MGSGVGADGVDTSQLVQHPGLGRCQALHMFLWPSSHFDAGKIKKNIEFLPLQLDEFFPSNSDLAFEVIFQ